MTFTDEDRQKMDNAAVDAQNDLEDIPDEALNKVAKWWRKWVSKAGHKRLGRVLLQYEDRGSK
jgi:hypothetical protein